MTGWRLGWLVAPERHVRDLEKLAQNLYISPPTLSQRAALACFEPETLAILERAAPRVQGAPRFPGAGVARAGLRIPVMPDRRIFRLRRLLAVRPRQREFLLAKRCKARESHSRPASISACIAPAATCASRTRWRWRSSRKASHGCAGICSHEQEQREKRHGSGKVIRRATATRARREESPRRQALRWVSGGAALGTVVWLLTLLGDADGRLLLAERRRPVRLMSRARSIHDVIERDRRRRAKVRLARIRGMREFASRELGLPANGSYTRYSDLGRPFVTWNVFATPELSLTPRRWCFPIAGCVNYRGYFREAEANDEAARLKSDGEDVYIGGVPAYSTLGYFDDPDPVVVRALAGDRHRAADLPRAVAPADLRARRHGVQRVVRERGRGDRPRCAGSPPRTTPSS